MFLCMCFWERVGERDTVEKVLRVYICVRAWGRSINIIRYGYVMYIATASVGAIVFKCGDGPDIEKCLGKGGGGERFQKRLALSASITLFSKVLFCLNVYAMALWRSLQKRYTLFSL